MFIFLSDLKYMVFKIPPNINISVHHAHKKFTVVSNLKHAHATSLKTQRQQNFKL